MSKTDWACLGAFILGFALFLIGANIPLWGGTSAGTQIAPYQAVTVGYTGLYLFIGSIMAYLLIYIYKELTKPNPPPPPSKKP